MKRDEIRIGLFGCGAIAQTHLEAIAHVPHVKLRAVQDIDPEAAGRTARKYQATAVSRPADIVGDDAMDAVIVCVPPAHHFDLIRQAVERGKHVLCEKPFTVSLKEAEEINRLSKKSGSLVMMASKFRFVEDVIEARKLVQSGVIGEVILMEVVFCSVVNMETRWNSDPKLSGGGVLIDNGSHAADVIRYLAGPIKSVYAQKGKNVQAVPVEDTARLYFKTGGPVIGVVDLSWSLYKNTPNYVSLVGTRGTIEIGWEKSQVWDAAKKTSRVFGGGYQKLNAFIRQIGYFADCVQTQTPPIPGIDDAMASVRVIETAYASIRQNGWMEIDS